MIEVDNRKVLSLFANLNSKKQDKAFKNALTTGAKILVKETKSQLRKTGIKNISKKSKKYGTSLSSGIKYKASKYKAKIHIMGDFRLKFFELGTTERFRYKKEHRKGTMRKIYKGSYTKKDGTVSHYMYEKPYKYNKRIGKAGKTGKINPYYFFAKAKANKEKEVFSNINKYLSDSIKKIANK